MRDADFEVFEEATYASASTVRPCLAASQGVTYAGS